MPSLKTADEYWRLAALARSGAWTARTVGAREAFLQTEFACELMACSIENLEGLKDELCAERRVGADLLRTTAFD